ncbi:hypothetical protein Bbelb_222210 [Branchiostoma belcheri]|nr:hypothetical protein Bbelb_222210 [Branchiostoma belcheri]
MVGTWELVVSMTICGWESVGEWMFKQDAAEQQKRSEVKNALDARHNKRKTISRVWTICRALVLEGVGYVSHITTKPLPPLVSGILETLSSSSVGAMYLAGSCVWLEHRESESLLPIRLDYGGVMRDPGATDSCIIYTGKAIIPDHYPGLRWFGSTVDGLSVAKDTPASRSLVEIKRFVVGNGHAFFSTKDRISSLASTVDGLSVAKPPPKAWERLSGAVCSWKRAQVF